MTQHEQPVPTASDAAPAASAAPSDEPIGTRQRPKVLPMILEMAIDVGVPLGCYWLSMTYFSRSEVLALLAAGIFPTLKSLSGLLRRRALDPVSLLILFGLLSGLTALLLGGGPKLLLVRESLFTGALGLACLISLLFRSRRPVMFFFGRFFSAGSDPARRARFDELWQYPGFRRVQRMITLVWGLVFFGEFLLRVVLIYNVSPAMVLAVSPVVLGTATLLAILWTFSYAARARKANAAARMAAPSPQF